MTAAILNTKSLKFYSRLLTSGLTKTSYLSASQRLMTVINHILEAKYIYYYHNIINFSEPKSFNISHLSV